MTVVRREPPGTTRPADPADALRVSPAGRALYCETGSRTSPLWHMHATPDPGRPAGADIVKRAVNKLSQQRYWHYIGKTKRETETL
jgi:hypothetical protein